MDLKKPIPIYAVVAIAVLVIALIGFFGFRAISGTAARQAPSSVDLYQKVNQLAQKGGGDYSKLSADDQKFLEVMSHGHGKKLLESAYARSNSPGGK